MTDRRALLVYLSALVAAGTLAAAAGAEPPPPLNDFTRSGWYLQGQGVYGLEDFGGSAENAVLQDGSATGITNDDAYGGSIAAGYRWLSWLAAGVEFEYVRTFDTKATVTDAQDVESRLSADTIIGSISLDARFYPMSWIFEPGSVVNRFQPFVKLAPAWAWADAENSLGQKFKQGDFVGRMGGGMDFYITQNWVITTSAIYNYPTGDLDDFNYWSFGAGVMYRFGGGED